MKKQYSKLAVILTTAMVAGNTMMAYAGPADDIALKSGQTAQTQQTQAAQPSEVPQVQAEAVQTQTQAQDDVQYGGPGTPTAQQINESQSVPEESAVQNTAVHVAVNYVYDNYGNVAALSMNLNNFEGIGGISYRAYNTAGGYLWWFRNGTLTGVPSDGNYVQAVQLQLTGEAAQQYDVYYSVTSSGQGKMGWAKNGEVAGTVDIGERLLSLEVVLLPKGSDAPVSAAPRYRSPYTPYMQVAEGATTLVNPDGSTYNGWLSDDHVRYYFVDGYALTGWHYIDGLKFYFDSYGRLVQDVDSLIGKQSSYLLKVNKTLNCLTVYAKDGNNGYVIPVKAMLTSVGDDTPIGTFKTPEKYRWRLMVNDTYTQYATRITQGFLLHSITYEETKEDTLLTEGYNGLGVSRSLGCVRLDCGNSKWIYDNCKLGTSVEIYEDPNVASPFDKPELIPISSDQRWDPTDPKFK